MTNHPTTDSARLKQKLLVIFFTGLTVFLAFAAVKEQNPFVYALLFVLPVGALVVSNPSGLLIALYYASYAKIMLPGLPGGLNVMTLLQMLVIGWSILHISVSHQRTGGRDPSSMFIVLFLINMFLIIAVRGFGMGSLGGELYGGKTYIELTIAIVFFLVASRISLSEKHIRILFWGTLICALIPAVVELSMYYTGGATWFIAHFFDLSDRLMIRSIEMGGGEAAGKARLTQARYVADVLLMIALVAPGIRKNKVLSWSFIAIAGLLVLYTGYRSRLIALGAMLCWWLIYTAKRRWAMSGMLFLIAVAGWVVALVVTPYLPSPAQRALSFLPLVADRIVDQSILIDAQSSLDFRWELWAVAWREIPRYLLIGKGVLLDVTGWAWLQSRAYNDPAFFVASHAYHSGPISLLLDFGIAGFVTGLCFMISICRMAWKGVNKYCSGRTDLLSLFYAYLTIQFSYSVLAFFLIFGNVKLNFPIIMINAVLLKVFLRELTRRHERERLAE